MVVLFLLVVCIGIMLSIHLRLAFFATPVDCFVYAQDIVRVVHGSLYPSFCVVKTRPIVSYVKVE